MPTRGLSRVRRTRPLRATSWSFSPPGTRATTRSFPDGRHRVQRAVCAGLGRREPDLIARRRPGEAALARPLGGEGRLLSGEVDDRDRPRVVQRKGVVEKRDPVRLRRQTRVADVSRGLVEHLPHRKLEARLPAEVAHDHEARPVRSPVRFLDALRDVAGRAARQGRRARVPAQTPGWFERQSMAIAISPEGDIESRFALGSSSGSESGLDGCLRKSFSGFPSQAAL